MINYRKLPIANALWHRIYLQNKSVFFQPKQYDTKKSSMLSPYEKTEPANISIFLVYVLYYQQIIFISTINFLFDKLLRWRWQLCTMYPLISIKQILYHFCLFKYCIKKQWWIHETGIQHEVCSTYSSEQCYYTAQRLPPAVWTNNLYILYSCIQRSILKRSKWGVSPPVLLKLGLKQDGNDVCEISSYSYKRKFTDLLRQGADDTKTQTDHVQVMELKYDREWEPVYQAFLLLPLVQEAPANPVRDQPKTHNCKLFIQQNASLV